jgi:type IV secretion system protein VirB9
MNKKLIILTLAVSLFAVNTHASQNPKALGTDSRIRHVLYNPNEVYEIKATYGFQTAIEFSEQEAIQVASIGDSIAWQVIPVGNRLFLKPVEQNPRTNLTVVTTKRTYYFHLSTVNSRLISDMTYLVRFEYPQNTSPSTREIFKAKSPSQYNFSYELKHDKKSGLVRAFDNGEFTYLQFKNISDLPAIFSVERGNQESVVNYRIEGPYVVIEKVGETFLLRRGKTVGTLVNKGFPNT